MNDIYALLKCFGERYINCDDEQAQFDVNYNREDLVSAFNAILAFAETLTKEK